MANKIIEWFVAERCQFCNTSLINQKVYTARGTLTTGIATSFSYVEPELFDAVDCPRCGKQKILGKRERKITGDDDGGQDNG